MLLFLVNPCLLVAVQPCMDWIPIKTIIKWVFFQTGQQFKYSNESYEMNFFQTAWQSVILWHSIYINYFKCMTHYLKSDSHLSKKIFFICFNDSPSKMMKNAFYLILKALLVLKIFKFLSWLFEYVEKTAWLER